jgi:outer membrane protein OmpA-like peptidoglycan-associated protein
MDRYGTIDPYLVSGLASLWLAARGRLVARRPCTTAAPSLIGLVVALIAMPVGAADRPSFDVEQFHPTPTGGGYFAVDSAYPVRHLGGSAGVYMNWAHEVLVLRRPDGSVPPGGEVIGAQLGMDVVASFGLLDRLELAIDLPFVADQSVDNRLLGAPGGLASAGLGDLRLETKILLYSLRLGGGGRIGFALAGGVSLPTGDAHSFLGQGGVVGRPRLVIEGRSPSDRFALAVDVGAVLRGERKLVDLSIGDQLSYGVAARVRLWRGLEALGEFGGVVGVASGAATRAVDAPAELTLGLRVRTRFGLAISAAGGLGVTRGYGAPDGRALVGLRYESPPRRPPPPAPAPPPPEPDRDGDGIIDRLDRCPGEPGPRANGGCPDLDQDGDGIVDRLDRCPTVPGLPADGGCPPPDRDHDGVVDAQDRCPDVRGVPENDGCPDIDSDGDGIVDRLDHCPFDPEVFNGLADDDGCPDVGAPLAELRDDRIVTFEPIAFDHGEVSRRSHRLLSVVAKLLELHPEIEKLRIEGHTDSHGLPVDNLDRSRRRAAAVRRHLIDINGIDPHRLSAQGFGSDRPLTDERDAAGPARNRRIDFVIVERKPPEGP